MNNKQHEMVLEKIHVSGVEEWYCPDCGRRFLVQWPPAYKMVILEQGEKDMRHNVSRRNRLVITERVEEPEPIEEFRLLPWIQWMDKVDFASRWNQIQ